MLLSVLGTIAVISVIETIAELYVTFCFRDYSRVICYYLFLRIKLSYMLLSVLGTIAELYVNICS